MTTAIKVTTVNGTEYEVWSDFIKRATFAKSTETGVTKMIRSSGYLSNDLSIRKAISISFGLPTFRK